MSNKQEDDMKPIVMSFSDVVKLIMKATNYGYADAAQVLDEAIEPHLHHQKQLAAKDELWQLVEEISEPARLTAEGHKYVHNRLKQLKQEKS